MVGKDLMPGFDQEITVGLGLCSKILLTGAGRCWLVKLCMTLSQLTVYFDCNYFVLETCVRGTNEI